MVRLDKGCAQHKANIKKIVVIFVGDDDVDVVVKTAPLFFPTTKAEECPEHQTNAASVKNSSLAGITEREMMTSRTWKCLSTRGDIFRRRPDGL